MRDITEETTGTGTATGTPSAPALPNDVISQILSFLPPKSLGRFKVVSKFFLSLINDAHFILHHIHIQGSTSSQLSLAAISHDSSPEILHTLHVSSPTPVTKQALPLTSNSAYSDLVGSCHGILCVSGFPHFLALLNPTTSTFHNIPLPISDPHIYTQSHWVVFGFGFDEFHKDYKLLRVHQLHNSDAQNPVGPREVYLYSLNRNSWTKADDFPYYLSHPMSHAKFLSNSLHWIASTTDPAVFDMTGLLWNGRLDNLIYDYVLIAFDLHSHKFRVLPLPDYALGEDLLVPRLSVGVSGDSLFLQVEHGPRFKRGLHLWVMKEYGVEESWTKLLSFPYMEVRSELMPITTLALSKEHGRVLMQQGEDCFWLELGTANIRDVVIQDGLPFLMELIGGHSCVFGGLVFVESLLCLSSRFGEQAGDAAGKDAGDVPKKSKGQKKRGDLLSSRFKLK